LFKEKSLKNKFLLKFLRNQYPWLYREINMERIWLSEITNCSRMSTGKIPHYPSVLANVKLFYQTSELMQRISSITKVAK
jgi:hypothetical protein